MRQLYSKHKKTILALVVASLLSLAYLASQGTFKSPQSSLSPTPTPAPQIVSSQKEFQALSAQRYSFLPSINFSSLPLSLPIYSVTGISTPELNPVFQKIIKSYKLKPSTENPYYYYSADKTIIASFNPTSRFVIYSIDGLRKSTAYIGNYNPSLAQANQNAIKFLSQFESYSQLKAQPESTEFYITDRVGNEYQLATSPDEANLISLSFSNTVNDYPFRYQSSADPVATIIVGQNNQVVRAQFTSQPLPQIQEASNHKLLTRDEILTALSQNQASFISAPLAGMPPDLTDLTNLEIFSLSLEYRYDQKLGSVVPYFLFKANTTSNARNASVFEVQFILQAVKL